MLNTCLTLFVALALSTSHGLANTIYSYVGNTFSQTSGSGGPTTANFITVSFEVATPLLANLTPWNSGNVTPISGSISDGVNILTTQESALFGVGVDTDQFGNIVKWLVQSQGPSPSGYLRLITAYYGSGAIDQTQIWANGLQFGETSVVSNADTPGSWSVASEVPEPGTGSPVVLALLTVLYLKKRSPSLICGREGTRPTSRR
jgi:hypothetical protein